MPARLPRAFERRSAKRVQGRAAAVAAVFPTRYGAFRQKHKKTNELNKKLA
jgi:hypothetical protein